jgi:hypothetical protein
VTEKQAEKIIDLLDQIGSLLGEIREGLSSNAERVERSVKLATEEVIKAVYEAARE